MGGPRDWEVVSSEHLQDCAVFRVVRNQARSPRSGRLHPFYCIEAAPWVNVVALTDADELVMVRQFRHGSRGVTLEIPGGLVDPGEAPAEAAVRELLEETGFVAGDTAETPAVSSEQGGDRRRCRSEVGGRLRNGIRSQRRDEGLRGGSPLSVDHD